MVVPNLWESGSKLRLGLCDPAFASYVSESHLERLRFVTFRVVDGPWAAGLGPGRSDPALASDGHLYLIGLNSFRLANLAVTSGLLSPYFF